MFKIFSNGKETIPSDIPKNIQDIIRQCWKDDPNERITLVNMLKMIEGDGLNHPTSHTTSLLVYQNSQAKNSEVSKQIYSSKELDLDINNLNLDKLNIKESPQE